MFTTLEEIALRTKLNRIFKKSKEDSKLNVVLIFLHQTETMKIPVEGGIVWVDLEMTGLDLNTDRIVEIAVIVTDKNLNIIQEVSKVEH